MYRYKNVLVGTRGSTPTRGRASVRAGGAPGVAGRAGARAGAHKRAAGRSRNGSTHLRTGGEAPANLPQSSQTVKYSSQSFQIDTYVYAYPCKANKLQDKISNLLRVS